MNNEQIKELFDRFQQMRMLVVGDIMIDAYLWGKVDRISPEAPVPVLAARDRERRLGGAGNVALNLRSLGAEAVLCSVCGNDEGADQLYDLLSESELSTEGIVRSNSRRTTVKTRVISGAQHIVRVDDEDKHGLSDQEEEALIEKVRSMLGSGSFDAVVFEDYNKGVLTRTVIEKVIALAREKSIISCVDPKKENFFAYKGVDLYKPNLKELAEGCKMDLNKNDRAGIEKAVGLLQERLGAHTTLLTLSENGVLIGSNGDFYAEPAHVRDIADVSGAGDTVISVAALSKAAGLNDKDVAKLSNLAGGLVCEMVGVVPVSKEKFLQECLELQ